MKIKTNKPNKVSSDIRPTFSYKLLFLESISRTNLKKWGLSDALQGHFDDVILPAIGGSHEGELLFKKRKITTNDKNI